MSTQERGVTDIRMRQSVILGVSALYTGTQGSTAQELIRRAREAVAKEMSELGTEGSIPAAELEGLMLERIFDQGEREEVRKIALRHAKGVLVGQRKSPGRDERLRIVNQRLSNLNK